MAAPADRMVSVKSRTHRSPPHRAQYRRDGPTQPVAIDERINQSSAKIIGFDEQYA
jgi:hypothetical protein